MTKILTVENQSYDLDMVPEEIEDIRYQNGKLECL